MSDGINRIPPIRPPGYGIKATAAIDRDKLQQGAVVEDQVTIDADQRQTLEPQNEEISLSVMTIRILAQGNIPEQTLAALTAFAPLGDLTDAPRLCDLLDARQVEFISWPPGVPLIQALEQAANQ